MADILLLEDSKEIADLIQLLLKLNGLESEIVFNEEEMLAKLDRCSLALIDVRLQNADGREICKRISSDVSGRKIPVILMSANKQLLENFKDWGAADIIEKPFDISRFITTIKKHLPGSG